MVLFIHPQKVKTKTNKEYILIKDTYTAKEMKEQLESIIADIKSNHYDELRVTIDC